MANRKAYILVQSWCIVLYVFYFVYLHFLGTNVNENWHKYLSAHCPALGGTETVEKKNMDIGMLVREYNRTYVLFTLR